MKKLGITLLTAVVGGAVAVGAYKFTESRYSGTSLEEKQKVYFANNPVKVSSAGPVDFTEAAAAVAPAVVHIKTTYSNSGQGASGGGDLGGMFDEFFGGRGRKMQRQPLRASGSGVILSEDGYIVTNNHVVENADKIDIVLSDKRQFQAKVIGTDPNTDLALIKISAKGLPVVKMGNSDVVKVGEWVLAVGYPLSLNTTVTAGIISAKGRGIGILGQQRNQNPFGGQDDADTPPVSSAIESFIQTDAAINKGNSGGALVNTSGELIGINAAIASQSGSYEGYGFAIPVNLAKKILDDFMKFGSVKRGYIGVTFNEMDADKAKELGVSDVNGLYVADVVAGGGAASAGVKKGDIIKKVDGVAISSSPELQEKIGRMRPGDKVNMTVLRDGGLKTFNVTLKGENELKTAAVPSKSAAELYNKLGASFSPVSAEAKRKYGITTGVVVTAIREGRLFDQNEIPVGTIITHINGVVVKSTDDVESALSKSGSNTKSGSSKINIIGITPDGWKIRTDLLF